MPPRTDDVDKRLKQLEARFAQMEKLNKTRIGDLNSINQKSRDHYSKLEARVGQAEKRMLKLEAEVRNASKEIASLDKDFFNRLDKVIKGVNSNLLKARDFDRDLETRIKRLEQGKR